MYRDAPLLMPCLRCGKDVSVDDGVIDPSGEGYYCKACGEAEAVLQARMEARRPTRIPFQWGMVALMVLLFVCIRFAPSLTRLSSRRYMAAPGGR